MNFFAHQDKARRQTQYLVLYLLLALLSILLIFNLLFYQVLYYNGFTGPQIWELYPKVMGVINLIIIATIVLGALFKMVALRRGGTAVAAMVDARAVPAEPKLFKEQQFRHVVEEMAIAAGLPMPKLYVLDQELAINAFVAGNQVHDTVLVITQGALQNFTREELQGVVAHEFSHILNADLLINLRLIGLLAGLLLIGKLGEILMHMRFLREWSWTYQSGGRVESQTQSKGSNQTLFWLGAGLTGVGYIGLFFGRWIKAAISRQREFLADASAVQYTRDPSGLVSALKRIQHTQLGSNLTHKNAEDISHLCFGAPLSIYFSNLLSTHPPLTERIARLDPKQQYPLMDSGSSEPEPEPEPESSA